MNGLSWDTSGDLAVYSSIAGFGVAFGWTLLKLLWSKTGL